MNELDGVNLREKSSINKKWIDWEVGVKACNDIGILP
jgi:hypothetical protein